MAKTHIVEKRIAEIHGDPNQIIPEMVNALGQVGAARKLDVHQSWLSSWLRRKGYIKQVKWVRLSVPELSKLEDAS